MSAAHEVLRNTDRRVGSRLPAAKPVYLADAAGWRDLTHGRIVERSSGGVTIQAYTPMPTGTRLDIEVLSESAGRPGCEQILRGRVTHLQGDAEAGYRMGVALDLGRARRKVVQRRPRKRAGGVEDVVVSRAEEPKAFPSEPVMRRPREFSSLKAAGTIIALGLCLLLYFLNRVDQSRVEADVLAEGRSFELIGEAESDSEELFHASSSLFGYSIGVGGDRDLDRDAYSRIPEYLESVDPHESLERLAYVGSTTPHDEGLLPTEPMSSPLGDALDLARRAMAAQASGDPLAARALSARALRVPGELPAPWVPLLEDLRATILDSSARQRPWPDFDNWVGLGPQLASVPVDAPVTVYVDTTNFVLTVARDGRPVLQFPVGIGSGGSTPHGVFSMGTKITQPVWYNGGDPVAANDPANPLGDRWMGLSDGEDPLVYGIHPTDAPESVGDAKSRGCIRMRPNDARTLYAMIPLGTPVVIGPGAADANL